METSRLLLVIVGDLNPTEVRGLVEASFGKLPRGNYKPEAMPQLAFDKSSVDITPRELADQLHSGIIHRAFADVARHLRDARGEFAVARSRV